MLYPRYAFQNSVLYIDQPEKYENLVRAGLLSYPVNFEFCPNDLNAALERLKISKPDLIISSLEFERGSVLEFVRKIRTELKSVPSIYISEPHLIEVQKQILKTGGAFDLVQRSDELDELIRKMDHAVRVSREFKKTRIESFIELHEASIEKGVTVIELLGSKEDALH